MRFSECCGSSVSWYTTEVIEEAARLHVYLCFFERGNLRKRRRRKRRNEGVKGGLMLEDLPCCRCFICLVVHIWWNNCYYHPILHLEKNRSSGELKKVKTLAKGRGRFRTLFLLIPNLRSFRHPHSLLGTRTEELDFLDIPLFSWLITNTFSNDFKIFNSKEKKKMTCKF